MGELETFFVLSWLPYLVLMKLVELFIPRWLKNGEPFKKGQTRKAERHVHPGCGIGWLLVASILESPGYCAVSHRSGGAEVVQAHPRRRLQQWLCFSKFPWEQVLLKPFEVP